MYQLLIVDDEMHVIEGLKFDLDIVKNEISQLYVANNIRQAKEIFLENRIDIMFCDIEMPQGSGLELLAWVKEYYSQTEVIFLTNHADFKYIKESIQLGSLDYLLKPVPVEELEHVLEKAKRKISQYHESRQHHQMWTQYQSVIVERFWLDLLERNVPSHITDIKEIIAQKNLPYTDNMSFIPILVSVQQWHKEIDLRDKKLIECALKNSAEEMVISGTSSNGLVIPLDMGVLLIMLAYEEGVDTDPELLILDVEAYIASCGHYCDLCCYIGSSCPIQDVVGTVEKLIFLDEDNVAYSNKVFLLNGEASSSQQIKLPDMNAWSVMLRKGNKEAVNAEVTNFLEELVHIEGLNAEVLRQFHQDFLQMLYSVLKLKGIQAHQIFSDTISTALSMNATRLIAYMQEWVKYSIEKAMNQAQEVEQKNTVIENVKHYISLHLDNFELSREDIANQAYLNPDYLSRIFKKETGVSLSDYLIQERIKLAKELLSKTDMLVGNIADAVGYLNFSHFSKMFKKYTHVNPLEYRQQMQSNK